MRCDNSQTCTRASKVGRHGSTVRGERETTMRLPNHLTMLLTTVALVAATTGCPSGGAGAGNGSPAWPTASKLTPTPLPGSVSWTGVYFISTGGTRGTMHLLE